MILGQRTADGGQRARQSRVAKDLLVLLLSAACCLPVAEAQTRIASDFEIEQMQKQLASSHDFLSQLSAHLNLGDLRATRNENAMSRAEYTTAFELASKQRVTARRASNLSQYATATAYAGLAKAKLGDAAQAFALLDEATRYAADDAKTWNLFSTAMSLVGRTAKATSAARNAVALADNQLDLNIYRHTLAWTLGDTPESERLLITVIDDLQSPAFASLRREIARKESFEIYSTARGEEAAYLALLNRARLRLASMYEKRGDVTRARATYQSVLKDRNDEPAALAGIARLSRSERDYAEAFEANPFSLELIRDYRRHLPSSEPVEGDSLGAQVRRALRGDARMAMALAKKYPENDALRGIADELTKAPAAPWLRGDVETATPAPAELRTLLTQQLTPDERRALDRVTLIATASFDASNATAPAGQTIFESGTIGDVKIRFSEPIAFTGVFAPNTPVRLTFRILGAADDALLIEPLKLEAGR
jgi:tetratricopeptide (TPR) repeat protein